MKSLPHPNVIYAGAWWCFQGHVDRGPRKSIDIDRRLGSATRLHEREPEDRDPSSYRLTLLQSPCNSDYAVGSPSPVAFREEPSQGGREIRRSHDHCFGYSRVDDCPPSSTTMRTLGCDSGTRSGPAMRLRSRSSGPTEAISIAAVQYLYLPFLSHASALMLSNSLK